MNYQLTLTGSADSTTDVILPISNFTLRWRDSTKDSYLSCTVPSVGKYGNLITARSNGNLVLASGSWELMDCPLTDIRLQRGGNRSSVVLTGYVAVSNPSPQSVTVNEALYSNEDPSGDFRLRVPVQQLLPGDTVTYESVARDIETIALSVNENQAQMELTLV